MITPDPYHLAGVGRPPAGPSDDGPRIGAVRILLWLVLVISLVGNMVASYSDRAALVHLVCGVVTGLSVIALVTQRLRGRRR
ncbi:hypothetical protein [Streptomyces sp. NPDC003023]|uniref:hypothetical protein n=1 Tax=Streptomyces sp. NPDC003023 TaxID=3364675 RepID=UPI003695A45B